MWVLEWESEGVTLSLVQGSWTLGRKGNALNFPNDSSISRQHAVLHVGGLENLENIHELPAFTLVDSKSRFGTFVNGAQIVENVPVNLRVGDKITFGAKSTVLVVGYKRMVARISRIQKANRRKLLEGCKAIGMHIVSQPIPEITHCIMDTGNFVATEKILWALVHAHPVVTTEWVQAIIVRESLSTDIPRCEGFLPVHTSDQMTPSYLLDTRRCSLYNDFLVIFLVPTSMVGLITAMGGQVVSAFLQTEVADDNELFDILDTTKRTAIVVFPGNGGELTQTDAMSSSMKEWNPSVMRRLRVMRRKKCSFVMHHELVASILFTRTPLYIAEDTVNALLGHTSLNEATVEQPPSIEQPQDIEQLPPTKEPQNTEQIQTAKASTTSQPLHAPAVAQEARVESSVVPESEVVVKSEPGIDEWSSSQNPSNNVSCDVAIDNSPTTIDAPMIKTEPRVSWMNSIPKNLTAKKPLVSSKKWGAREEPEPVIKAAPMSPPKEVQVAYNPPTNMTPAGAWVSKKPLHEKTVVVPDDGIPPATVVLSNLVVRRNPVVLDEIATPRYLSRGEDNLVANPSVRNFKKFKKNPVPRARQLITRYLNEIPVDLERQRAYEKQQEELEEQERLAQELFNTNMRSTKQLRFV